jgi:glucan phosphoethanolaminetransferase (alkaline phosphatase superfamily)
MRVRFQSSEVASRQRARAIVGLFFLLLISPGICWAIQQPGLMSAIQGLVIPAALLTAYMAIWGRRLWLGLLLLSPFVLLAPAEFGFISAYRHPSDYDILATLSESSYREIHDFLGPLLWPMIAAFACVLVIATLTPFLAKRYRMRWYGDSRIYAIVIALSLPTAIFCFSSFESRGNFRERAMGGASGLASYADNLRAGFPFGVVLRADAYYKSWHEMQIQADKLHNFRFGAHEVGKAGRRQIYVFVIGESSRRDHWSLFGYARPTNPELGAITNLVPLPDMVSTWPASRLAIPVLLTRKSGTDSQSYFREASILRAFAEAGFHTYWLSNQMAVGQYDSPISIYAYEADKLRFFNPATWSDAGTYDEVLLPALSQAIEESSTDLFVVLHTMGSHGKYAYRYPPSFDRFQPSLTTPGDAPYNEKNFNSYDNSILYTDHFLASVVKILQATDEIAGMFYSSDHGEDLLNATCSLSGHGNPSRPDFIIPALFWYSDSYARTFPDQIENLRSNSKRAVTSENVFESLIDFGNLSFPSHKANMSLLSNTLETRARLVNAFGTVDFDKATIGKNCPILMP